MLTKEELRNTLIWLKSSINESLIGLLRTKNKPNHIKELQNLLEEESNLVIKYYHDQSIDEIKTFLYDEYGYLQYKLKNTYKYIREDEKPLIQTHLENLEALCGPFFLQYHSKIDSLGKRFGGYQTGEQIDERKIRKWISQFGPNPNNKIVALRLLNSIEFVRAEDIFNAFSKKHQELMISGKNIIPIQLLTFLESQPEMVHFYSKAVKRVGGEFKLNDISGNITDILEKNELDNICLLFIDDMIGSGTQQKSAFKELLTEKGKNEHLQPNYVDFSNRLSHYEIEQVKKVKGYLLVYHSTKHGKIEVENFFRENGLNIDIIVGSERELCKCFDDNLCPLGNLIFEKSEDLLEAKELCKKIGYELLDGEYKDNEKQQLSALGFKDSQQLIVFFHKTPNNTLPIFWKHGNYNGNKWYPLFPLPDLS